MRRPLLLTLLYLAACSAAEAAAPPAVVQLVTLMGQRLAISREVAWTKYEKYLPVRDLKREGDLLASLVQKGAALELSESQVRSFFQAQILASCAYQEELMSAWKAGKPLPDHPPEDLVLTIRPELDKITGSMLQLLAGLNFNDPGFERYAAHTLEKAGYSESVASLAASAFVTQRQ